MADILIESFNATGYDSPTWSENVGAGCTVDEDSTGIADSAGGSTQILKCQNVSPNWGAFTRRTLAADNPITYSQFFIYVAAEGLTNSSGCQMAVARDSSSRATFALGLYQNGSGVLTWTLDIYSNGGSVGSGAFPAFATGQWYKHEIKYDKTNMLWEWRVNGVSVASGSLTGTVSNGIKDFRFGGFDGYTYTAYFDALNINSTGYLTTGPAIPVFMNQYRQRRR